MTQDKKIVAGGLLRILADTNELLYKICTLYWRLDAGRHDSFASLLLRNRGSLLDSADVIAATILKMGSEIPGSSASLAQSSSVKQEDITTKISDAAQQLYLDHGKVIQDIETLLVTLPLQEFDAVRELFISLIKQHLQYQEDLKYISQKAN